MSKFEAVTWHMERELKSRLEQAARAEGSSVDELLEKVIREWLADRAAAEDGAAAQKVLHETARRSIGTLEGSDPERSEHAEQILRSKISAKRERRTGRASGAMPD